VEKEEGSKVSKLVFKPPKFGGSAGHTGYYRTERLHPTRLKVKREVLFESLLIFKPTQLKRAAWPV